MPKRPYSQISSSGMSFSKESTTTTTDLSVDVICLVFEYLPLSEVLHNQSLVCKLFYDAHLQHCRSSVKHLTLLGHYMLKKHSNAPVEPQSEIVRKQMLFEYARNTSTISSLATINPSRCHLKLVVGLEESAYSAIGTKFKSVTSLELFQPALERHYKPITAMINAWSCEEGGNCPNQLTDLKIFFSKEIYRPNGLHISRGNNSCCLAYLLAEALTPTKAPALRRLVIVPGNWLVTSKNHGNHNGYRGPLLAKINLSQVTAVNAPHFGNPFTDLRELTIKSDSVAVKWAATGAPVLCRLSSLTIHFGHIREFVQALPTEEGAAAVGAGLRRFSLQGVLAQWSLTKLVQLLVARLTTAKGEQEATTTNDRLEELRVAWEYHHHQNSPVEALASAVCFPALTTLHLVKSTLLHRDDEMSALSALFPNLAHLRLDHNHRAVGRANFVSFSSPNSSYCQDCVDHVWNAFHITNPKGKPVHRFLAYLDLASGNIQLLPSSTAPACKAALVRRAVAAWPKLVSITLQIDDFPQGEAVSRLQYLYRCENLRLRDPVTGEPLQEQDLKWTVEEVPY